MYLVTGSSIFHLKRQYRYLHASMFNKQDTRADCIFPVIDVVRANFVVTMRGEFWNENRQIHICALLDPLTPLDPFLGRYHLVGIFFEWYDVLLPIYFIGQVQLLMQLESVWELSWEEDFGTKIVLQAHAVGSTNSIGSVPWKIPLGWYLL